MKTLDFLTHLRTLDIQLSIDNGKLRVNAPKGAVTPEIKSELNARKADILSLLSAMDPILTQQPVGPLPLSLAQEHLWQLHRLTPDTVAYNMYAIFRLWGQLDVAAFESAMAAVVERHAILRTSFPRSANGEPEQSISQGSAVTLQRVTLSSIATNDELQSFVEAELRRPFDLSSGPLFRPILVQISPTEHALLFVMHHMISDGHSFGVLYDDLERAYRTACQGEDVDWIPLSLQYADYAAWQRNWLESDASASDRNFWRNQLTGDVPALELPFDHPHPLHPSADGDHVELRLPLQTSAALHELCRREEITLFTAVLAAFNILLHRHSGQCDLVVCTPVAARDRIEFSRLIGYFNNTILLRTDLARVNTIRELLQHTQVTVMNALAHQMFPFKEVAGFPNMARTPLSRAMVVVQNSSDQSLQLSGLESKIVPVFNHAVQYDLSVEVTVDSLQQLEGRLMYRKVLFERDTAEKLANEFVAIVEEMLANAEGALSKSGSEPLTAKRNHNEIVRPPYTAPRNDLERRLVQIWQEVLNVETVGIHEGFFELGGHSLLALRLFTRMEQETGTNLPLSTLFQTTTIAHLAHLIEGETAGTSWDILVPIQPLGSKPPLFCVHGIEGGVLGYRDLANALGGDQPFFGLQAAGQDGRGSHELSIEAMASRYIDRMRSYQPRGPYRIGGYCFGGVVAYEMACQLERLGEKVSLLALFESAMPDTMEFHNSFWERLAAVWKNIPTWMNDYSGMSAHQLFNRIRSTFTRVWSIIQRNPDVERRVRVEETLDIDINNLPSKSIELTDINLKATLQYAPDQYNGAVILFRARNRSLNEIAFGSLDPTMGWGQLAKGGVKVQLVDGFHRNMHLAPYVNSLAAELGKHLDLEIQEERHTPVQSNPQR